MHIPGPPEFAHAGVDDRVAGQSALPFRQCVVVFPPREAIKLALQVFDRQLRLVIQQVIGELAPAQLAQETVCVPVQVLARAAVINGIPGLVR